MKSERRHELEKNELADRLGAGIESVQSFLPAILGGIAVVAVLALGWGIYSSFAKRKASEAWTEYYFALDEADADSFADLAEKFSGSTAAAWAQQTAANGYLEKGLQALYVNKANGVELLEQAIGEFKQLEDHDSPAIRTKALLGLAQCNESLGNLDEAAGYYEKLTNSTTQPRLISKANERLAFLNSESGKEFYTWFKTLDPKPDAPINLPTDLLNPPTTPNIDFSDITGSSDESSESTSPVAVETDPAAPVEPTDIPAPPELEAPTGNLDLPAPDSDGLDLSSSGGDSLPEPTVEK